MVENLRVAEGGFKMPGLILLDGFNPGLYGGEWLRLGRDGAWTGLEAGRVNGATSARAAQTGRCDG